MFNTPSPLFSPLGTSRILQFSMNLVPLFGVLFMHWSVFALLYVFWLETLGISFFNAMMIFFAKGGESEGPHFTKAISFLLIRVFILGFYLIFIVVFIGLMIDGKQGKGYEWINYFLLIEPSFRLTVGSFFLIKLVEFVYFYFVKNERDITNPREFSSVFDGRLIVIHVVLVGGYFMYDYFSRTFGNHTGLVAFAAVFVSVKSLVELFANPFKVLVKK